ncbi:MarR family transcriptional regulator [Rugosimonospora acidiphila]|uniref:MarR family transcriptional regulator n=1 Tax=Rugosimonospora acidiphila TaxID=556531 RepID=A0ABP9SFM8_9ACTN
MTADPDPDPVVRAQQLRVAVGRVSRRLRQIYTSTPGAGPSFTEVAVLVRLEREGPAAPSELAARERVTSQAIAAVIRELEGRGLISRSPDPVDGRKTVIAITEAGRALLRDREQVVMGGLIRALGDSYSQAELRRLDAAIPLLNRLADLI